MADEHREAEPPVGAPPAEPVLALGKLVWISARADGSVRVTAHDVDLVALVGLLGLPGWSLRGNGTNPSESAVWAAHHTPDGRNDVTAFLDMTAPGADEILARALALRTAEGT